MNEMIGAEKVPQLMERGIIEVAPLAYMRGRTLSNSFIIVDEAQNTTAAQMKMVLTRLGFKSRMVVTGDITQIDLPRHQKSGLIIAMNILKGVEGVSFNLFDKNDVVPIAKKLSELGEPIDQVKRVFTTQPVIENSLIKGSVIHTDKYGNVIVNITEKLFNEVGNGNPFTIFFKNGRYFIESISKNYYEVPTAEKLALFNEAGFLEIAINKGVSGNGGGASSLLGLNVGDTIRMEFHPKGSKESIDSLFKRDL
jgi:hypothetical protein